MAGPLGPLPVPFPLVPLCRFSSQLIPLPQVPPVLPAPPRNLPGGPCVCLYVSRRPRMVTAVSDVREKIGLKFVEKFWYCVVPS